jgi:hypothetical protein
MKTRTAKPNFFNSLSNAAVQLLGARPVDPTIEEEVQWSDLPATLDVAPTLNLSKQELKYGYDRRKEWIWGAEPTRVIDWDDPDVPDMMTACGYAVRFQYRPVQTARHPRREQDYCIQLDQDMAANSFIAFDPRHKFHRLYFLLDARACRLLKKHLYDMIDFEPHQLSAVAAVIGGRHGKLNDYPDVLVKPIGVLTGVMYATEKLGDGESIYLHMMGEISHHPPALCVDAKGRLWCAGGNYTAPIPGITD